MTIICKEIYASLVRRRPIRSTIVNRSNCVLCSRYWKSRVESRAFFAGRPGPPHRNLEVVNAVPCRRRRGRTAAGRCGWRNWGFFANRLRINDPCREVLLAPAHRPRCHLLAQCQNSRRILTHDNKGYRGLGRVPAGFEWPLRRRRSRVSLRSVAPRFGT